MTTTTATMFNSASRAIRLAVGSLLLATTTVTATEPRPDVSPASNWFSTRDGGLEFQPAASKFGRLLLSGSGSTSGYESEFVDGSETYYNDYAQAWRLLGFYVDCNAPQNNVNQCGGDSQDGDGGDEDSCQRYLLWAAVSSVK